MGNELLNGDTYEGLFEGEFYTEDEKPGTQVNKIIHTEPKRVVGFMGNRQKGKTTIIDLIATAMSEERLKVAVIDFTDKQDLYYMKCWCNLDREESDIARVDILSIGKLEPFKINKNYHLFTQNRPVAKKEEVYRIVETVKAEYDIVLMDIDTYKDDYKYIFDDIIFVHDLSIIDIKELKDRMKVVIKSGVSVSKFKFIINKKVNAKIKVNDILVCLSEPIREIEDRLVEGIGGEGGGDGVGVGGIGNTELAHINLGNNLVYTIDLSEELVKNQLDSIYKGNGIVDMPDGIKEGIRVIMEGICGGQAVAGVGRGNSRGILGLLGKLRR